MNNNNLKETQMTTNTDRNSKNVTLSPWGVPGRTGLGSPVGLFSHYAFKEQIFYV